VSDERKRKLVKRHLIATADERTWRFDRPVLFLGEWCREWLRREVWGPMDATVARPYGVAPGQQEKDCGHVNSVFESLMLELREQLNEIHGVKRSERYWRILVGPWLLLFSHTLFNRWSSIRQALAEHDVGGMTRVAATGEELVPASFAEYPDKWLSHYWNQHIFARIAEEWFSVPMETASPDLPENGNESFHVVGPQQGVRTRLRRSARRTLAALLASATRVSSRDTDTFFLATYLPPVQEWLLQLSLGELPKYWRSVAAPKVRLDPAMRGRLAQRADRSEGFEDCLRTLLVEQIPTAYVEGYDALCASVSSLPWPKRPRLVCTSNSHWGDDVFKAWLAEKAEHGVPFVVGQHGGYYGVSKWDLFSEYHEMKTADRFLSWGWSEEGRTIIAPGPALKLVGAREGAWAPGGGALLVTTPFMRYTRDTYDICAFQANYLNEQFEFVESLPAEIRGRLTVRLHPSHGSIGQPQDVRWRDRCPDLRLDPGTLPLNEALSRSRLHVATYNGTTFLETLGLNIPTIVFWNPCDNPLRDSAVPYFDRLEKAGLFHRDPRSAAAKVAEIWEDVRGWWQRREIQGAREFFCRRFARTVDRPVAELRNALVAVSAPR
jgi:putative transferase (TIGR04331 family)